MLENTNKAIAYNTVYTYIRLCVTLVCGLLSTRYALQALGYTDFGLTSLIGSVIIFIGVINTTMISTSNRFIAAAIGRNVEGLPNKIFNVNLIIHIAIAVFTLLVALPLGHLYIIKYVHYSGSLENAVIYYYISTIASIISFIGVPYNGLMLARERFLAFSLTESIISIIKVGLIYLLLYLSYNRLIAYGLIVGLLTALPSLIYYIYCRYRFSDIIKFKFVREKKLYKDVLTFSSYVGYGAVVQVGQIQGAAVIINLFFNTVMNTALGIANYLKSAISLCTQNLAKPVAPQITKSYAAGNFARTEQLVIFISKASFLLAFLIAVPFLTETETIIKLWLGEVPPYAVLFSRLMVIDVVVGALSKGMAEYVYATGKIKWYQLIINSVLLLSIVIGYVLLKYGYPPQALLYTYIVIEFAAFVFRIMILKFDLHFPVSKLLKKSFLRSLIVVIVCIPILFFPLPTHSVGIRLLLTIMYTMIVTFIFGLSKNEKSRVFSFLRPKISHVK